MENPPRRMECVQYRTQEGFRNTRTIGLARRCGVFFLRIQGLETVVEYLQIAHNYTI